MLRRAEGSGQQPSERTAYPAIPGAQRPHASTLQRAGQCWQHAPCWAVNVNLEEALAPRSPPQGAIMNVLGAAATLLALQVRLVQSYGF